MAMSAKLSAATVRIDICWSPEAVAGAALAAVDVLRSVNLLAAMRAPRSPAPLVWRWCCTDSGRAPRWLPRDSGFRGRADMVLVPGWHAQSGPHLDQLVQQSQAALTRVIQVHAHGGLVAGLYNAAALLGAAGLLQQRTAVVPWAFVASVLRHGDGVQLLSDRAWTVDQRVWTCASPVLATEVVLDMLRQTPVAELAMAAAHVLLHSSDRQTVAASIVDGQHQRILPAGALQRACRWLEAHLAEPYNLSATANAAATSGRTLLRHFASVYGHSPLDHLHDLRVAQARVLLETTYVSVEQVSRMCGYQDTGTFRRIFQRKTGELPASYRERYRLRTSRRRWTGSEPETIAPERPKALVT